MRFFYRIIIFLFCFSLTSFLFTYQFNQRSSRTIRRKTFLSNEHFVLRNEKDKLRKFFGNKLSDGEYKEVEGIILEIKMERVNKGEVNKKKLKGLIEKLKLKTKQKGKNQQAN